MGKSLEERIKEAGIIPKPQPPLTVCCSRIARVIDGKHYCVACGKEAEMREQQTELPSPSGDTA